MEELDYHLCRASIILDFGATGGVKFVCQTIFYKRGRFLENELMPSLLSEIPIRKKSKEPLKWFWLWRPL